MSAFKPDKWSCPTMLSTVPCGMNLNIKLSVIVNLHPTGYLQIPSSTTAGLVNMIISRKAVMLIGLQFTHYCLICFDLYFTSKLKKNHANLLDATN